MCIHRECATTDPAVLLEYGNIDSYARFLGILVKVISR